MNTEPGLKHTCEGCWQYSVKHEILIYLPILSPFQPKFLSPFVVVSTLPILGWIPNGAGTMV